MCVCGIEAAMFLQLLMLHLFHRVEEGDDDDDVDEGKKCVCVCVEGFICSVSLSRWGLQGSLGL